MDLNLDLIKLNFSSTYPHIYIFFDVLKSQPKIVCTGNDIACSGWESGDGSQKVPHTWRLNVFSASGGFIWLHILYLSLC